MKVLKRIARISPMLGILPVMFFAQSCIMLRSEMSYSYNHAVKNKPYDAIIVPGVPYEDAGMSQLMKMRVCWAAYLYKAGITKNIIFSGGAVYTPFVEGKIMAMMGEKLGIPAEHIIVEDKAEHSTENMYFSYKIAKKRGLERIAVATDPFQSFMLSQFDGKLKLYDVEFLPFIPKYFRNTLDTADFSVDGEKARVQNFESLTARKSFAQRFKGTRGKDIVLDNSTNISSTQK